MKKYFVLVALAAVVTLASTLAGAQASPTATRRADLQLGATFSYESKPDYGPDKFHGFGFYGDLDVKWHMGLNFDFHELKGPDPVIYQRSYEVGPRFIFPVKGRLVPYAKVSYGRGVFNFAGTNSSGQTVEIANLAYNIYAVGGGLDIKILPGLNLRAIDYEYQRWPGFPPNTINPQVISSGIAYHFHGRDRFAQ